MLIASLAVVALSVEAGLSGQAAAQPKLDPENTIYLDLNNGRVVIQLFPDLAPKTVAQIKTLARQGFYDNTPFHRVIEGFMAQGGDPTGTGMGGSKLPNLPAEFTNLRHFLRGTCGMARSQDPNSGNSQFFIMFAPGTVAGWQLHDLGAGCAGHGICRPHQAWHRAERRDGGAARSDRPYARGGGRALVRRQPSRA